MSDTLNYIESYFENRLSDTEKVRFEERCAEDEGFAGEVAFYISSREALRQTLLAQKVPLWSAENAAAATPAAAPVKKLSFRSWLPYAAAACLVLAIAMYFFYPSANPKQLAENYAAQNLMQISHTLDASKDSLQEGIGAYNRGDYKTAIVFFQDVYKRDPANSDANRYTGLAYLMQNDYANAVRQFDELAAKKLFSNPGLFLKAVTLLKRNGAGDREAAKSLLEQVRDGGLEGKSEAGAWLKMW